MVWYPVKQIIAVSSTGSIAASIEAKIQKRLSMHALLSMGMHLRPRNAYIVLSSIIH